MSSFLYFLLFITVSSTFAQSQTKVPVTVYYETLCPDSIKFYTSQLYPTWNSPMKPFMNLTLVPFGKASYTMVGGNYTFKCHHGENECVGNKVQACALKKIPDMDMQFKYINCLMANSKTKDEYPTKMCATEVKLAADVSDAIETCASSNEGNEYLAALGNVTMNYQNPLTSVPAVEFNHKMNDKDKDAISNFQSVLCSYISGTKPAECTKSGASTLFPPLILVLASLFLH